LTRCASAQTPETSHEQCCCCAPLALEHEREAEVSRCCLQSCLTVHVSKGRHRHTCCCKVVLLRMLVLQTKEGSAHSRTCQGGSAHACTASLYPVAARSPSPSRRCAAPAGAGKGMR
jgi:hypothetical protein